MANFMLRRATFMTFLPVLAALCVTSVVSRDPFDVGLALMFGMAIFLSSHHQQALPDQHQAAVVAD